MDIKTQLKKDRVEAMRNKDEVAKNALAMALTAIQRAEVAGKEAKELTDTEVLNILKKEVAQRKDSAEAFAQGGRDDLVKKELAEADVLAKYLPQPLSEAELDEIVKTEVAKAEAELGEKPQMRQMGMIVKAVNAVAAGRADGKTVAEKVKAALA
ncbi:MAG: GatB/YqeY domain-containing protein [Propionibacteriaceae bacterium]|jgi:uncharacterized protein YqeY|nr:GatB/YqeY domain-containing protein [Propionibacteriaceae bacterium]